jgi:CheY-like chemotaxis protein
MGCRPPPRRAPGTQVQAAGDRGLSLDATPSPKVLVVDDDEHFGSAPADMLRFVGFDPTICTSARQALNLMKVCDFQLVLTDVRMPEMDGLEFYRFLAAVDQALAQRIIFITGDLGNSDTRRMVEQTEVVCIEKPVRFDDLERAVVRALDRIRDHEVGLGTWLHSRSPDPGELQPEAPHLLKQADNLQAEQELLNLQKDWNTAMIKADGDMLHQLLADEFEITDHTGSTRRKMEYVLLATSEVRPTQSLQTDLVKARIYGDAAVVSGQASVREQSEGEELIRQHRFTNTWIKRGGQWRCVASQTTAVGMGAESDTHPTSVR